ncbi:hypothetical protein sync_2225 [Synechococcus sp. CC9311]|nr:hypothetical protein sync_2225 [Synechococcus sp. CC9311]
MAAAVVNLLLKPKNEWIDTSLFVWVWSGVCFVVFGLKSLHFASPSFIEVHSGLAALVPQLFR